MLPIYCGQTFTIRQSFRNNYYLPWIKSKRQHQNQRHLLQVSQTKIEIQKCDKMQRKIRRKKYFRREEAVINKRTLSEIWHDFCQFTTLHGIKNIYQDLRYLNKSSTKNALPRK